MFGGGAEGSVRQSASHEPSMGGGGGVPNPSYGGGGVSNPSYQMPQQPMPPTMRKR